MFICSLNFVLIYSVLFTPLSTANPLPNHFFAIFCEISAKIGACHDKECDKMAESDRIKDTLKVVTTHFSGSLEALRALEALRELMVV